MFCFFPANFYVIHIQNWKPSPNRAAIGFSQITFPITVLSKDDHTDFAHEERLGLRYWTMIYAICVVVDESKCLDIPILELLIICEHLPFSLGYKLIQRQLLVLRNLAIWRWYPWSWRLSFEMLKILVQWILHKTPNRLLQFHLGVQLDLCIFGALSPIRHSSDDRCPSVRQNELWRPSSLLHRSPLSCFWLLSGSTPKFSPIFPIPCPLLDQSFWTSRCRTVVIMGMVTFNMVFLVGLFLIIALMATVTMIYFIWPRCTRPELYSTCCRKRAQATWRCEANQWE